MSKHINVNPGQYKVAGRERPGEDIVQRDHKKALAKNREDHPANRRGSKKKR
jgi:hypothetical protein